MKPSHLTRVTGRHFIAEETNKVQRYRNVLKSWFSLWRTRVSFWSLEIVQKNKKDNNPRQCCGSGMFIPDPGSWILPIPDPGSRISDPGSKNSNKRERWKIFFCLTFLCSHKFHKIVNYFSFEVLKKKIWANFQRNIELFTNKIVKKLLKIWSWDPESEIRKKPIPDPGSRGQKGTGSRIRIRNTDPRHWILATV